MAYASAADSNPNYLTQQMMLQRQRNRAHASALQQLKQANNDYEGPTVSLKRPTADSIAEAASAEPANPKDKYKRAIARAKYA